MGLGVGRILTQGLGDLTPYLLTQGYLDWATGGAIVSLHNARDAVLSADASGVIRMASARDTVYLVYVGDD